MGNTDLYNQKYYEELEFGLKSETRSDHKRILELLNVGATDRVLEIGWPLYPSTRPLRVDLT